MKTIFEYSQEPLLPRWRFVARMARFTLLAAVADGVVLLAGTVGYHFFDGLDWLDASVNASLVMTGNGPVHAPQTSAAKIFTVVFALLGVMMFAVVIGVLLVPVFHRILHKFRVNHSDKKKS